MVPPESPQRAGDLDLSVVIPAHNAASFLSESVRELTAHCQKAGVSLQVVLVDDGSTDRTLSVAERLREREASIEVVRLAKNRGKGAALRQGVPSCRGRVIAFTDADLPYPPDQVLEVARQAEAVGIAVGARDMAPGGKRAYTPGRRLASGLFGYLVWHVFSLEIRDTQCGLKAFRAPIARDLFAVSRVEGFAFDVELLVLARHWHLTVSEVPVVMRPAQHSSVRIYRHALRIVRDLAWLQARQLRGLPERPTAGE